MVQFLGSIIEFPLFKVELDAAKVVYDGKSQASVNAVTVTTVDVLSQLPAPELSKNGQSLFVKETGSTFVFDAAQSAQNDGVSILKGWVLNKKKLNAFDFGAKNSAISVASLEAASLFASSNGIKVELPENSSFKLDNCNVDTSKFIGSGDLVFPNHNRKMLPKYRKGYGDNSVITLEDEYGQHIDASNRYSGFGCSAIANGREYIAVRCGKNHYFVPTEPSFVVLYVLNRTKNNEITKQILFTSEVGQDVRDINIVTMPQYSNRLLVKFALQTSESSFETRLIVFNCTNNTVELVRKINLPTSQFTWGNTLITPQGFLLIPSYGLDGSCKIYRSTAAFDYTATAEIEVTQTAQFESSGSAEPTICYFDDQLICFWRMGAGVSGRFNRTYNLEGSSGWGANVSLGREVHAPFVDPYNFGKSELLMMCSLGSARSLLATFASQNLENWYSTAQILCAGDTTLANGQSGGYPSFVDYGENLSVQSYADFRHSNMLLTSRLDARLIKKSLVSALNSYEAQRSVHRDSSTGWGEYSLGTSAATIDVKIALKRNLTATKVRLRMTGSSTTTFVEILNSSGSVVATSSSPTINANPYQDVEFTLPSTALTPGIYTVRIQRKETANPLVFNWNTSGIVKNKVIKNRIIDILGLTSASSSTLWNNAGIHVDLY